MLTGSPPTSPRRTTARASSRRRSSTSAGSTSSSTTRASRGGRPCSTHDEESWRRVMATNVEAIVLPLAGRPADDARAALRPDRQHRLRLRLARPEQRALPGHVRARTSGAARSRQPAYHTSKGAVLNLTRDLAAAVAPWGVTVNTISPGMFLTEQSKGIVSDEVIASLSRDDARSAASASRRRSGTRSASSPRRRRPSSPGRSCASTAAGRSGERADESRRRSRRPGSQAAVQVVPDPAPGAARRRRRRARVRHLRHRPAHPRGGPADGELSADPGPRAVGRGRRGRSGGDARPDRRPRRRRSLAPLRRLCRVPARPRQPLPALGRDRRHAARRLGRPRRSLPSATPMCSPEGYPLGCASIIEPVACAPAGVKQPRAGARPLAR